eukprot:356135-Chlamydomonas_euryale.AAC.5
MGGRASTRARLPAGRGLRRPAGGRDGGPQGSGLNGPLNPKSTVVDGWLKNTHRVRSVGRGMLRFACAVASAVATRFCWLAGGRNAHTLS